VADTIEGLKRALAAQEALAKAQEEAAKKRADAENKAAQLNAKHAQERAMLEKSIIDSEKREKESEREKQKTIRENVTNVQQGYFAASTNIGAAHINQEYVKDTEQRTRKMAAIERENMQEVFKLQSELGNATRRGDSVAVKRLEEQLKNEREKAKEKTDSDTFSLQMEQMDKDFEKSVKLKQNEVANEVARKRWDYQTDEHEKRMRDEVDYYKKSLDLENSLHQDRLKNIETYARSRADAIKKYAGTSLETFRSGRGANPLEEQKRMVLASADKDEEMKMAQIRIWTRPNDRSGKIPG